MTTGYSIYSNEFDAVSNPSLGCRIRIGVLVFLYFVMGYQIEPGFTSIDFMDITTPLDIVFPKIPYFILFYTLGYMMPLVPCLLVRDRDHFVAGALGYIGILTVSFICFRLIPIGLHKDLASGEGFFSAWMLLQQTIDTNVNNFPSLHVSLNVFALLMLKSQQRKAYLICMPLCLGIVLSTLAVKQHYVLDVVSGTLLALLFYRLHPLLGRFGALFATPYFGHRSIAAQKPYN